MKSKVKVSVSLLAADFSQLARDVKRVEEAGADLLHLDIMDGQFVNNISFGPGIVRSLKGKTKLPFDTHLMIENPQRYIKEFAEAGSKIITFHIETVKNPKKVAKLIKLIKKAGCSPGISLNPPTPISEIKPFLKNVDLILIMTVNPGFGGQEFISSTLRKIEKLRKIINSKKLRVDLEVDGGINQETAKMAVSAGANILVVGTYLFQSENLKKRIKDLQCIE